MLRVLVPTLALVLSFVPGGGHAEEAPTYDRVSLAASARDQVANDTLSAELYAQQEGQDLTALTREVNERVQWALDEAREREGVTAQTLDYQTYPIHRNQTLVGWRVTQGLRLRSTDPEALSTLVGRLQDRLALRGISYGISPQRRQEAEAELIDQALEAFAQRARQVAERLGRPGYRLVHLDVGTSDQVAQPRFARAMAMEATAMAAPPAMEAGTQEVVVTVSGTIELQLGQP